jgi:hypothetical protein
VEALIERRNGDVYFNTSASRTELVDAAGVDVRVCAAGASVAVRRVNRSRHGVASPFMSAWVSSDGVELVQNFIGSRRSRPAEHRGSAGDVERGRLTAASSGRLVISMRPRAQA